MIPFKMEVSGDRTNLDSIVLSLLSSMSPLANHFMGVQLLKAKSRAVYLSGLTYSKNGEYLPAAGREERSRLEDLPLAPDQLEELGRVIQREVQMTPERTYFRVVKDRIELAVVGLEWEGTNARNLLYASLPKES